ncbi:hypothetical protein Dimus_013218 [Dionaea muscipula]
MSVIHLKKKDVVKSKVRGVEIEFDHEKLATILGIPGNNGILETTEEKMMMLMHQKDRREKEDERNKDDFDWEAMIDESCLLRENTDTEKGFMMLRMRLEVLRKCRRDSVSCSHGSARAKGQGISGVDPSGPTDRIPEAELLKFQAEFERKRQTDFMMIWRRPKLRMPDF